MVLEQNTLSDAVGTKRKRPSSFAASKRSKRPRKTLDEPIEISDSENSDGRSKTSQTSDSEVDTLGPESEEGVRDTPTVGPTSDDEARGEGTTANHELVDDTALLQVCLLTLGSNCYG